MTTTFLLNGEPAFDLSLQDRGLHYGDGLFETIAVRRGRIAFWQRHMARLQQGCQRLHIPVPEPADLLAEARNLLYGETEAALKIIVTRGPGGRGYRTPEFDHTRPTHIFARYDLPDYPQSWRTDGVALRVCSTRLGLNPALAGIKHLNRLEQVLARSEWRGEAIFEGLMLDTNDNVIAGTMSNVFFVRDNALHTPDVNSSGVAGIIRDVMLEIIQQQSLPLHVGHYTLGDILAADELFITNSLFGILPVCRLEQHTYPAGTITRQLETTLRIEEMNEAL